MTRIEKQIEDQFNQVEQSQMEKYPLLRGCIRDGVLYPGLYEESPFKMMVLLKEPYDGWDAETETPVGGDFAFIDVISNLETHCLEGLNKTWIKIAAMTFAIKNDAEYTENLSYEQIKEGLSCVCFINLSKTPWKTRTNVNDDSYLERVKTWEPIVKAQLQSIDFDIALYGYTWDSSEINPINPNEQWDNNKTKDVKFYNRKTSDNKNLTVQILRYEDSDKIIVNGYHPAYGNSACWQTEYIQDYMKNNKE